uniref:Uncharacterized protein n=1 Tax=Arundo donax TaxID=35708 RepID=A0A0A9CEQ6_ARUDO
MLRYSHSLFVLYGVLYLDHILCVMLL